MSTPESKTRPRPLVPRVIFISSFAGLLVASALLFAKEPPTDILIQSTTDVQGYIAPCG